VSNRNGVPYPPGIPEHICDKFKQLACEVYEAGFDRYSSRAILHRLRWHYQVERGDIFFKINNNYSARLARWFLKMYPELGGFFETRERRVGVNSSAHNMYGYQPPNAI
jgi:hypothetical protein